MYVLNVIKVYNFGNFEASKMMVNYYYTRSILIFVLSLHMIHINNGIMIWCTQLPEQDTHKVTVLPVY